VGFEIVGEITAVRPIAVGRRIREIRRLHKAYGPGRWRKLKGVANVRLPDGTILRGEIHWYEAHGLGRRELKVKRLLSEEP
jgi:hypothetical protein